MCNHGNKSQRPLNKSSSTILLRNMLPTDEKLHLAVCCTKDDHKKVALHALQPPKPLLNNLLEGQWTLDRQCLHALQPLKPLLNNLLEGQWTLDRQCLSPEIH